VKGHLADAFRRVANRVALLAAALSASANAFADAARAASRHAKLAASTAVVCETAPPPRVDNTWAPAALAFGRATACGARPVGVVPRYAWKARSTFG
jgi:hypothetical protein